MRWSSAGVLLKLCLRSFLCLLVCPVFQARVGKWAFLKIQFSVFTKTNVRLAGTYELTRRSTVLSSSTEVLHETSLLLTIHWFQWEKLTLVYLFWMQTARAVRAADSYFTFYLWSSVSNLPEAIAVGNNCTVKSASPKRQIIVQVTDMWKWIVAAF